MTIKHLVISGGGPLGFRYFGSLEKLEQEGFWNVKDIESIYGTSIGSIIGAFMCLKYDWETLKTYVIERPWHDVLKVNAKQIFDSYYKKGLFDKNVIEILFKPLLQAKDLSLNITLKEFYEFSKIDLHIFTFDLNQFKTIEITHVLNPNLGLLDALTMSSSLPGLFMPTIIDNCCYIDGGVMCNYPLNYCLRDHDKKDEILGIKCSYNHDTEQFSNIKITSESSLLEYVICISVNTMNYLKNSVPIENIENTINCLIVDNPLTLEAIQESIRNKELRRTLVKLGEDDAIKFLSSIYR